MQIIRCTAKLQKEMGLKKNDLIDSIEGATTLGGWHANLLHIDRRKCVLFANDRTLSNFIVPDLKREHIRQLDRECKDLLPFFKRTGPKKPIDYHLIEKFLVHPSRC